MPRIVHLGFGNFHRAHQAWYTARANADTGSDWRITAVSMRRRDLAEALAPSGGAYTLGTRGPEGLTAQRIDLHDRILVARDAPYSVVEAIADPDTHLVTLTITEKGYVVGDEADPDGAVGLLARGLAERKRSGAPLTVLSCDNLSSNGQVTAIAVQDIATRLGLEIDNYLRAAVAFPDSMVDRITPATTDAIRAEIAATTGVEEPEPVLTEAFSEWVIADDFAGPRPAWDQVGAVMAHDVAAFEARKLLLLNAAHSYMAYAGRLCGLTYVHEAIANRALRQGVETLWAEARTAIPQDIHDGLPSYEAALIDRFAVPEMRHELHQIAADGSLKLSQRIVPILLARKGDAPAARSALAAWITYLWRFGPGAVLAPDPGAANLLALAQTEAPEGLIPPVLDKLGLSALTPPDQAALAKAVRDWAKGVVN